MKSRVNFFIIVLMFFCWIGVLAKYIYEIYGLYQSGSMTSYYLWVTAFASLIGLAVLLIGFLSIKLNNYFHQRIVDRSDYGTK